MFRGDVVIEVLKGCVVGAVGLEFGARGGRDELFGGGLLGRYTPVQTERERAGEEAGLEEPGCSHADWMRKRRERQGCFAGALRTDEEQRRQQIPAG